MTRKQQTYITNDNSTMARISWDAHERLSFASHYVHRTMVDILTALVLTMIPEPTHKRGEYDVIAELMVAIDYLKPLEEDQHED